MTHQPGFAVHRRRFLEAAGAGVLVGALGRDDARRARGEEVAVQGASPNGVTADAAAAADRPAQIAITLDLEMSRNFPQWEITHWDYEKGNLNDETKRYAVEACRRVKERGGVLHCFAVGRVFEQESVDWLQEIVAAGHPLGNHTYDHVNVLATRPQEVQFRFQRSPWLIVGKTAQEAIAENVRLCAAAMKARLDIEPAGFRTPGGFASGLKERRDVQELLLAQGYTWVSSLYPPHANQDARERLPGEEVFASIVAAQEAAQPFVYESGLVEVPMSPISDIGAFRGGRWPLDSFLEAIRRGVEWAIEQRAAFDFLGHPSCLYVADPEFKTIDLICDLVEQAGERAALSDLNALAQRAAPAEKS